MLRLIQNFALSLGIECRVLLFGQMTIFNTEGPKKERGKNGGRKEGRQKGGGEGRGLSCVLPIASPVLVHQGVWRVAAKGTALLSQGPLLFHGPRLHASRRPSPVPAPEVTSSLRPTPPFHAFPFSGIANCARALRQRHQQGGQRAEGSGGRGWGQVGWVVKVLHRGQRQGQVRERWPP